MDINQNYREAVKTIKEAILRSQYHAATSVNKEQLSLYYGIGRYVSENSRTGFWGKGAIEQISSLLQKELPGLRGFSASNIILIYIHLYFVICDKSTKIMLAKRQNFVFFSPAHILLSV